MQRQVPPYRQQTRRRDVGVLQRCLVALLVLLLAASGLGHGLFADHAASAATASLEQGAPSHHADGEPCCPEHGDQPPAAVCGTGGACTMSAALAAAAVPVSVGAEPVAARSEAIPPGRQLTPHRRPPKPLLNV